MENLRIKQIEVSASLRPGSSDRFSGYAVIGLPFRTGRVLALRRFPASSLGPGHIDLGGWSPFAPPRFDMFRRSV